MKFLTGCRHSESHVKRQIDEMIIGGGRVKCLIYSRLWLQPDLLEYLKITHNTLFLVSILSQ